MVGQDGTPKTALRQNRRHPRRLPWRIVAATGLESVRKITPPVMSNLLCAGRSPPETLGLSSGLDRMLKMAIHLQGLSGMKDRG
jgi:hypothetical protein